MLSVNQKSAKHILCIQLGLGTISFEFLGLK